MSKKSLVQRFTAGGQSVPEAADQLDRAVEDILKRLRKGETVSLPGLGKLVPGPKPTFHLEKETRSKGAPRARR